MSTEPKRRGRRPSKAQLAARAEARAQNISAPGREQIDHATCIAYAQRIAIQLCVAHFPQAVAEGKHWKPYGDLWGVLEQIDNMTCVLVVGTQEQCHAINQARADRTAEAVRTGTPTLEDRILACVSKPPAAAPTRPSSPAAALFRGKRKTP